MARHYSQTDRSLLPVICTHTFMDHMFATYSSYAHASDIQQVCMDTCAALTDLQEESISSLCTNLFGPVTHKPKHQDSFLLSSFYPLYQNYNDFFVLCWCVHIAYVSIWCPVDIVVFEFGFY